jgi:phosphopantetheinyl transferase (holo-ACP synthase)
VYYIIFYKNFYLKQFTKTLWLKLSKNKSKKMNLFAHIAKSFTQKNAQSKSIVKYIKGNAFHVDIVFNPLKKLNLKLVQYVPDFQAKMNYYMIPNVISIIVYFNF